MLLPSALVVLRWTANRLYPLGVWSNSYRVSDRPAISQTAALARVAEDGRNLFAAFCFTIVIHIVDLGCIATAYWHGANAKGPCGDWDWTLWFLRYPLDVTLRYENLLLVIVAYACQFAAVLFAMLLIILLFRHNLFYLRLIYLRDRIPRQKVDESIVLDFEDQDLRFGLLPLSGQFNTQLLLLVIVGCFSVISRIVNTNMKWLQAYLNKDLFGNVTNVRGLVHCIVDHRDMLFQPPVQILFPIVWLIMFAVVLLPARAKLLPRKVQKRPRGGARGYLLELIPPNTKIDIDTQSLTKAGSVDEIAKLFSRHSFWPVGDTMAELYAVCVFCAFFFIVTPVLPSRSVVLGVLIYYCLLVVASYICSKFLFWVFKYLIRAVDPRLVGTT